MSLLFIGVSLIVLGVFFTPFTRQSLKIDQEELLEGFGGWRKVGLTIVYIVDVFTLSSIKGWLIIATSALPVWGLPALFILLCKAG